MARPEKNVLTVISSMSYAIFAPNIYEKHVNTLHIIMYIFIISIINHFCLNYTTNEFNDQTQENNR